MVIILQNTFGILVSRWRCLRKSLNVSAEHAVDIILACCILHNYLRSASCENYCPPGYGDSVDSSGGIVDGIWRAQDNGLLTDIEATTARNPTTAATNVRDSFIRYLNNEGALEWQARHVNRTE